MGGGDGLHIDLSQGDGTVQSHEPGVDPLYPAAELPAGPGGGKKRAGCFFQKGGLTFPEESPEDNYFRIITS